MLGYSFTVKTKAIFAYAHNKTINVTDRTFIYLVALCVLSVLLNSVTPLLLLLSERSHVAFKINKKLCCYFCCFCCFCPNVLIWLSKEIRSYVVMLLLLLLLLSSSSS